MSKLAIFMMMLVNFLLSAICLYSLWRPPEIIEDLNQNQFIFLGGGMVFLGLGVVGLLLFFFEEPEQTKEVNK